MEFEITQVGQLKMRNFSMLGCGISLPILKLTVVEDGKFMSVYSCYEGICRNF